MPARIGIDVSGPFFRKDPGATIRQNVQRMLAALASEGELAIRGELGASHAPISGLGTHVNQYVHGRIISVEPAGHVWTYHAVISVNNVGFTPAQGIALMAAASVREGQTHAFKRVASGLRSARAVLRANLTEGLE